jgi:coatomer protein complex subunit epsilon
MMATAIQVLGLAAKYELASTKEAKEAVVEELKTLQANTNEAESSTSFQLYAAHVFLMAGMMREALQLVHLGITMEHISLSLEIYLKIDRIDLALEQLSLLKQADEDSVLAQLGTVHVKTATGRSTSADAVHSLSAMSEQYGPSVMLLNCLAVAQMTSGNWEAAETALNEALADDSQSSSMVDTLINLVVCYQNMGKGMASITPLLTQLKASHPSHPFVEGLVRVEGAFERESIKYMLEPIA